MSESRTTAEKRLCACFASDQSLMVYLPDNDSVVKLLRLLEGQPIPGVRNLHPAYASLLIVFDPLLQNHAAIERRITDDIQQLDSITLPEPRMVEIPVRYGGVDGPDLDELARLHDMSPQSVIDLHTSAEYRVFFVGFVPGFAYLGGLPDELATPRLEAPRKRVPKGSVAIGGSHTGVYPFETPGGWRLIGRTPLEIFDADSAELSRLRIGDRVRFMPIA